ncbi:hypothetical protein [Pontibacter akesuensis]|uniref:SpoIIAA-like n=2 Tax=Pontibacter akesuensis TaxID=388950 RepID=A0A1I7KYH8_9BACT|nr:hypothetical protein [Pontibacter akesuensis]GHA80015.1 hypothetical protein GCM10007389_37890 [Pontibacter akesuensis]SFV02491.1 hypothetical protein SAMN04487941_0114 [Pontibacter akesuensis]
MIVYHNSIITLDYDPATDILEVALPDMQAHSISEVERCLHIIVEHVISYDVKKLLLDSSKAVVEVEDETYRSLILQFSRELINTRLQKVARIATPVASQEHRANLMAQEVHQLKPAVAYENFAGRAAALDWLLV